MVLTVVAVAVVPVALYYKQSYYRENEKWEDPNDRRRRVLAIELIIHRPRVSTLSNDLNGHTVRSLLVWEIDNEVPKCVD